MNIGAGCATDKLLPKKEIPAKLIKVAQTFILIVYTTIDKTTRYL